MTAVPRKSARDSRSASVLLCAGVALVASAGLLGCRGQTSDDPPIMPERNMYDTERYNPESYSQFYPDHRTMRTPVEGTVARDRYEDDPEVSTGLLADKSGLRDDGAAGRPSSGPGASRSCSRAGRSASPSTARRATAERATARAWSSASATR